MWEQKVFRSRSKHPTLRKGIIGTTTLLGSASIAINSTSVLAHAAEGTLSTENTISGKAASTSESVTVEQPTISSAAPTETKEDSKPVNEEIHNEETITAPSEGGSVKEEGNVLTPDSEDEEETEPVPTPIPDLSDPEEKPTPTPKPEEKPDPKPEPEKPKPEPEKPKPEPEQETPAPEPSKPVEPEKETPTPQSEFEVIYVQQPAQQPVQEPVTEPIVVHSPENIVPVGPQQTTASHGSIKFDRNLTTTEFIEEIGESARKIGQEQELYASVMIAQAILESGSGGSQLAQAPNYNLFGIKGAHEGKSVSFATQEDTGGGNMTTIQASFRAYDDYEDCFEDYAKLLKEGISGNSDFYKGAWKTTTENYEEATAFLTGKYATDTSYNKKLNGLIETYNLTQYDHPKEESEATNQVASSGYLLPLNDFVVSSPFGMRGSEFHRGIDLAAGEGMPIFASKAGKVLVAEYHYSWGNYVVIQHDNGETTLYAHQRNFAVNAGERVEQGQTIGFVGSTGNSTGSHLHFELCLDSTLAVERLVDPATVLF
ncbi:hypothetical protein IGI49_004146 [Enterococcus sp. AZ071]